jgi:hypothetical protein
MKGMIMAMREKLSDSAFINCIIFCFSVKVTFITKLVKTVSITCSDELIIGFEIDLKDRNPLPLI